MTEQGQQVIHHLCILGNVPQSEREGCEGQVSSILRLLELSHSSCYISSWQGMAEAPWGVSGQFSAPRWFEGPSLEAWCPKREGSRSIWWQEVGMSVMSFVWPVSWNI